MLRLLRASVLAWGGGHFQRWLQRYLASHMQQHIAIASSRKQSFSALLRCAWWPPGNNSVQQKGLCRLRHQMPWSFCSWFLEISLLESAAMLRAAHSMWRASQRGDTQDPRPRWASGPKPASWVTAAPDSSTWGQRTTCLAGHSPWESRQGQGGCWYKPHSDGGDHKDASDRNHHQTVCWELRNKTGSLHILLNSHKDLQRYRSLSFWNIRNQGSDKLFAPDHNFKNYSHNFVFCTASSLTNNIF